MLGVHGPALVLTSPFQRSRGMRSSYGGPGPLMSRYLPLEMLGKSFVAIVYRAVDLPWKAIIRTREAFPAVREARRWQEDIS